MVLVKSDAIKILVMVNATDTITPIRTVCF